MKIEVKRGKRHNDCLLIIKKYGKSIAFKWCEVNALYHMSRQIEPINLRIRFTQAQILDFL